MDKEEPTKKAAECLKQSIKLWRKEVKENKTFYGEDASTFLKLLNEAERGIEKGNIEKALIVTDHICRRLEQYPLRKSLKLFKEANGIQKQNPAVKDHPFFKKWEKKFIVVETLLNEDKNNEAVSLLEKYLEEKTKVGLWKPLCLCL